VFGDDRGYFFETFNAKVWQEAGITQPFVQDNEAFSSRGVLRGLHYQRGEHAQAKLVRVIHGEVLDVAVDCRPGSPTYGQHHAVVLSGEKKNQFYVPRGFAHGYVVLSETALFAYKCDNFYQPQAEGGVRFDDPSLAIDWQVPASEIKLSEKDSILPKFGEHLPAL
jgi:dTDP-4-dehydrorhamnose 3,5-epimerase